MDVVSVLTSQSWDCLETILRCRCTNVSSWSWSKKVFDVSISSKNWTSYLVLIMAPNVFGLGLVHIVKMFCAVVLSCPIKTCLNSWVRPAHSDSSNRPDQQEVHNGSSFFPKYNKYQQHNYEETCKLLKGSCHKSLIPVTLILHLCGVQHSESAKQSIFTT